MAQKTNAPVPTTTKVGRPATEPEGTTAVAEAEGQIQEGSGKKKRRQKKQRASMPAELSVGADGKSVLNEQGKFIGVPVNWTPQFKALKEKDFADESTFIEFKAHRIEQSIQDDLNRVKSLREEAANIRKVGGDPKIRKAVRKVNKMKEGLSNLLAMLEKEGIKI